MPITALLAFFTALGLLTACGGTREGPPSNPLAMPAGFCEIWAERACNETVIERCVATDVEACRDAQANFCLGLARDNFAGDNAEECLDAVELAYEDAELTADERDTVRKLGTPCDQIVSGSGGSDACVQHSDCETLGLSCVRALGQAMGICQDADIVQGGFPCSGPNQVCAEDFYCDGQNCLAAAGAGAPCTLDMPCRSDFNCERPTGVPPPLGASDATCVPKVGIGEACAKDADCFSDICAIGAAGGICVENVVLSQTDPVCTDLRQ